MKTMHRIAGLMLGATGLALAGSAGQAQSTLAGAACANPPALHCPDKDCPNTLIAELGNATEPKTGRKFFLDFPCDLKKNEKVIFILNLHGGGSSAQWQRHYFPVMDYTAKYRLVVATPGGTNGGWSAADDQYLRNVVEQVETAVGKQNIKAFWLAGHSLGGQTSNRLINNDPFFSERLKGWVSLSGGRLGSKREDVRATIPGPPPGAPAAGGVPAIPAAPAPARAGAGRGPAAGSGGLAADASILPPRPFSFIYETGEHELTTAGLPGDSKWGQKLGCGAQTKPRELADTKAGYVYDSRTNGARGPIWGNKPAPGVAKLYDYPKCADGRLVMDIVRMGKGHTEGLEPKITEEIVKLVVKAS